MENNKKQPNPYVDLHTVLAYFKISRAKAEKLIRQGMPLLKIGRARRFRLNDVEEWVKTQQQ